MFNLPWNKIWELGTRAEEISALAADVAKVMDKHRPIIDHIIKTLADKNA